MEWFDGGVLNAIIACRQNKALFVVYIYDESEASLSTSEAWNNIEVVKLLKDNSYIALKVYKDSLEYNQFSQFFAVFIFPSIYCINLTGKPLVVMSGQQTGEMIKNKLNEAFLKIKEQLSTISGAATASVTSSAAQAKNDDESSTSMESVDSSSTPSEAVEEKLKRYEQKIKERRAKRIESERQREDQKEKDHREQGRNLAKFKQMQSEQQNKNWLRERRKQKEDALLAREEVRAKLEQDRRERQDKNSTASSDQKSQSHSQSSYKSSTSGTSRIQLRLPMGPTKVIEINTSSTLSVLRVKVAELLDAHPNKISLTSAYPRRDLTSDMDSQSMVELELSPTGVVIVKVDKKSSVAVDNSNMVLETLMNLFNFIMWLFGVLKNAVVSLFSSPSKNTDTCSKATDSHSTLRDGDSRVRKFRQEDFKDDSSDDMGTYNGNSTQQQ